MVGLTGNSLILFWQMAETIENKTDLVDAMSVMQQMPAARATALVQNVQWVALKDFMFFI